MKKTLLENYMNEMSGRLIVVLGMHRSGTSAVTRGLQVLGVELGDHLMPPVEGNNPKGFWEDLDINALNIDMLNALSMDWHFLTPIQINDVELLRKRGYLLHAVDLLRNKTSNTQVFGFKDPRVAKLLPFWKEVFAHCQFDVHYIISLRHPMSVCRSLEKRDGFDFEKSYYLWLGHVVNCFTGTIGEKCSLVDYDHLMDSVEAEMTRLAKELSLPVDSAQLEKFKSDFIDEELRHTIYKAHDLEVDDRVPPLMREIYSVLAEVLGGKLSMEDANFQKRVLRWQDEFLRMKPLLSYADKLGGEKTLAIEKAQHAEQALAASDNLTFSIGDAYEISGNVGAPNATLTYVDGFTKTVTSDVNGDYSIIVPPNWSGTVTPSKTGVTFVPSSRDYTNVTVDHILENYNVQKLFLSAGSQDGWVLESTSRSSMGGSLNRTARTLQVGDDAANRQYRTILSFNTSSLPDNAIITKVTLKVKYAGRVGTNPFSTHGKLLVDIRRGLFSNNSALQIQDFQAKANRNNVGNVPNKLVNKWYTKTWTRGILSYVNKKGITQIRLRFYKGDNGDSGADFLKLYSGNVGAASRHNLSLNTAFRKANIKQTAGLSVTDKPASYFDELVHAVWSACKQDRLTSSFHHEIIPRAI